MLKPYRPKCHQCNRKPAVRLSLDGEFGEVIAYCSIRCAALAAVDRVIVGDLEWCDVHIAWEEGDKLRRCRKEQEEIEAHLATLPPAEQA